MTYTPERIGPYQLIEVLGEGATGRVYRAQQDEPAREVALKVLRTAALARDAAARFQRESEILASMNHPLIARLFAAGTSDTPTGPVSWLAMELVHGDSIAGHARSLDREARVQLMVEVCRAVHHAHTRGIIHRDLKPDNILVDEHGTPRILDFGVAHAALADASLTHTGAVIGTVPYMAPELLAGQSRAVDPRSDVYALGVILYQLLVDRLPYPAMQSATVMESLETLRRQGPERLSMHDPAARGDLETVVMKAIAREPERRYGSALDLALDLERLLAHLPIEARPPTIAYTLGLFARRHRALAAGATIAFLALIVATPVLVHYAMDERRAREEAEAINAFMVRMLTSADPSQARGRVVTVREVVDEARFSLASDRTLPAVVADSLRRTLGLTYMHLGEYEFALSLLGEARTAALARGNRLLADRLLVETASVLQQMGRYQEAEQQLAPLMDDTMPRSEDALRVRLSGEQTLAQVIALSGRQAEARTRLEDLFERARIALGEDDALTTSIGSDVATVLRDLGELEAAQGLAEEVWTRRVDRLGHDHPDTLLSRNLIGALHHARGEHARALSVFTEVAEARERVLGPDHIQAMTTLQNLAAILIELGRQEEALPVLDRVVDGIVAHFGPEHTLSLRLQNIRAYALEDLGRLEEAEAVFRTIVAAQERAGDVHHPENLAHYNNLAMLLMKRDALDEASEVFARLIIATREAVGDTHPYFLIFQSNYGECLVRRQDFSLAIEMLEFAHGGLTTLAGATHPRTVTAAERLAAAYRGAGRMADAEGLGLP